MNEQPIRAPRRTPWSSLLALGTGAFVFLGFVAYGLLAPATFRATAQIVLRPVGDKPLTLPTSPPASERLRQAALAQESLDRVAKELEIEPTLIANRSQLAQIAREPEKLGDVLLPWQADLLRHEPSLKPSN